MYLILIFLPLLGSILSGIFGRKLGVFGSQIITTSFVIITTFLSILAFFEVGFYNNPVLLSLFTWIDSESLNIKLSFYFDSLTVSMLIPVLIVSSLVHIYSIGYMKGDPHNQRFFSYLSLFTFMMIILVTSNNLLLMFVGWEGVGVCSYLLVNFWFTRIAANQSSISAFLTNRVGDCFLTIGMFAILWSFGNIDYSTIFSLSPYINENIITIIGICLLIGAMAKSSQFGLHVWLPMAMEGPTPVSALIHAATMVTAGVYLLMRTSPLIEYSSTVLLLCLLLGAVTTVFSSLIGLFQQDIKKVIAYSTMSQLGMMVIAVGLSSYNIALFHLINHAFYKALLFLGAGSVIHAVSDNQDFRKFGGLKSFLPLTYSVMLIASLSLMAFPFMTGFYSKDFILESTFGAFSFSGTIVYCIATIAAMFTTLYSIKVLYLTFLTNPNGSLVNHKRAHEGDIFLTVPLILLAVFSIFFGFICKDIFIGIGSDFFSDNALFIHYNNEILLDTEFAVNTLYKLLPLVFTITLSILFIIMSEFLPKQILTFKYSNIGYTIFSLLNQRFFIELFYNKYITNVVLNLGGQTTKVLDKGSIEYFGPFGLEKSLISLSINLSKFDAKSVVFYVLYYILGAIMFISLDYLVWHNINYSLIIFLSAFISVSLVYNNLETDIQISKFKLINSNINYLDYFILFVLIVVFTYVFKYMDSFYTFIINLPSVVDSLKIVSIYFTEVEFFKISYYNLLGLLTFPLFFYLIYILRNYIKKVFIYFYNNNIKMGLKVAFYSFILLLFMFNIFINSAAEIYDFIIINLFIIINFFQDISIFPENYLDFNFCTLKEDYIYNAYSDNDNVKYMIPSSSGGTTNNLGINRYGPLSDIMRGNDPLYISEANSRWELLHMALIMHNGKFTPRDIASIKQIVHDLDRLTKFFDRKFPVEYVNVSHSACYTGYKTPRTYYGFRGYYSKYPKPNITQNTPASLINYIVYKFRPINRSVIFNRHFNRFIIMDKYSDLSSMKIPIGGDIKGWGHWLECQWERIVDTDIATGNIKQVKLQDVYDTFIHPKVVENNFYYVIRCFYPDITMNDPITYDMVRTLKNFDKKRYPYLPWHMVHLITYFEATGAESYKDVC